ncbi:ParB N-terminal domain-containing protein [Bradyrhizobium sp. BEA-2-5]|uniref:ParB N-terminal domain-containing protein n=1 Tax=Bradyrhizobium sp. BEA-2-5 TaxID=3080015 RepID=UPI00293F5E3E|nr:ParB N-terminal domain-containing protein [Bradyrhizobium sp. BEA-2-5]WOH80337.1 ParB N-terminal domain-containing protein [Bradyrhizobium sp. BEA-2-5]
MFDSVNVTSEYDVVKLQVGQLRPSEEIDIEGARALANTIAESGRWTTPILVERRHWVIMDGHHRYFCASQLGLSLIPCVLLSYDDPNLHVTSWSDSEPLAVDRIIQAGLSGNLLSFKTTRHRLKVQLPSCSVQLDDLR